MAYIYENKAHTDYSIEYMNNLGIDTETQTAILAMREFEEKKFADRELANENRPAIKVGKIQSK